MTNDALSRVRARQLQMKESELTALRTDARWHAVVQYRTGAETPMNVEIYLDEIGDIHDHIERT